MKLIKPSYEILPQAPGLEGVYKQIELAGRHCYKSLDKITETSAKKFVDRMIKSGHGAMLEHGTIYLYIPYDKLQEGNSYIWDDQTDRHYDTRVVKYHNNAHSKVHYDENYNAYITTNYRVIIENNWIQDLEYMCEPEFHHERRYTVKFITDQGILREFTRHRVFSFAVESTRYCNYSKDKFGNEVTFILPPWMDEIQLGTHDSYKIIDQISAFNLNTFNTDDREELIFLSSLAFSEIQYFNLLNKGWKPQQARNVLPLATKCEMIMTGFISDWEHFFSLRASEAGAKGVHPQADELASSLYLELIKNNNGMYKTFKNKY